MKTWTRKIEEAIDGCVVLLGLMTDGSYESELCRAEQLRALRQGKCVIPVWLQLAGADIPLHFEAKTWRDYPQQLAELVADIRNRRGAALDREYAARRIGSVRLRKCSVLGHFEGFSNNLRTMRVCQRKTTASAGDVSNHGPMVIAAENG